MRTRLIRALVSLVVMAALFQAVTAAEPRPPYDPRPLMQAAKPEAQGAFTFAVFGDSYANPPLANLMKMVASKRPTFAVTTGDMVAAGADPKQWDTLSDRAGWFLSSIPTWPVVGNHELAGGRDIGAASFERFYGLSSEDYSFIFRECKFIVLGYGRDADQLAFLRKALADSASYEHVFVFRHAPFYTIGSKSAGEVPNKATEMTKLFTQYHVTAVFSGHDHIYYRTQRDGVGYLTAGIAGAGMYSLKRLGEAQRGDAYMGVRGDDFVLHVPGRPERVVHRRNSSTDAWLFATFVHVDGAKVTAQTVSVKGEVWEKFALPAAARQPVLH